MTQISYKKVIDWILPILLGATVDMLFEIKRELAGINTSLAVAMTKIDNDERRIGALEERHRELELTLSRRR